MNGVVNRIWVGSWLCHGAGIDDASLPPLERFQRLLFRREFECPADASASIALSADSRYALYLNGEPVGRGPVRSQPRRWTFDEYDLGGLVRPGTNVLVALVTWYGEPNAFWFPAVQESGLGGRATLIADLSVAGEVLGSDDAWQVAPAPAWVAPPRAYYDGIPVAAVDLRQLPIGWQLGEPGQLDWQPALLLPAHHLGGLSRTRPPANPYGALAPRPLAPLGGERVRGRVTRVWLSDQTPAVTARPTDDVQRAIARPLRPAGPAVDLQPGESLLLEVDFGRIVCGLTELDLKAPEGTVVDMLHRERRLEPSRLQQGAPTGSRVVTRGEQCHHRAQEICGLRFAYLLVRPESGGRVEFDALHVQEQVQQWAGDAHFQSSEPRLDALWRAGVRTTQVCSLDAFVDCPTREQRAWTGDGVVPSLVHLVSNDDWRPVWRYLELADSPRPDGILPMALSGETEGSAGLTIPAWSLYWAHVVHEVWRHSPEHDRIAALMPSYERVLRWFARHQDASGVLVDLPEWNMVDWSSVFVDGRSSVLTALWVRALREFAAICRDLGNDGSARWALGLVARAERGFDQFWDAERGCVLDHTPSASGDGPGEPSRRAASQLAQATALLAGLAPDRDRVTRWMVGRDHLVERTLLQTGGRFDQARFDDYVAGHQRVDWDVATQSVVAGPFASHLVNEAIRRFAPADALRGSLERWHRFLVDGYDTFGEQWSHLDGSPAHGWSSCPTVDLVRGVAGISPGAPGFASATVAPLQMGVAAFDCSVPTPWGPLRVVRDEDSLTVDSPVTVRVVGGQVARAFKPGVHVLGLGLEPPRSRLHNPL